MLLFKIDITTYILSGLILFAANVVGEKPEYQLPEVWVPAAYGGVPDNCVIGGYDAHLNGFYVARIKYRNNIIPGQLVPHKRAAYVAIEWQELSFDQYEVLCNADVLWQEVQDARIPSNAIPVGYTEHGNLTYIGRVRLESTQSLGVVDARGYVSVPINCKVHRFWDYEIMVDPYASIFDRPNYIGPAKSVEFFPKPIKSFVQLTDAEVSLPILSKSDHATVLPTEGASTSVGL